METKTNSNHRTDSRPGVISKNGQSKSQQKFDLSRRELDVIRLLADGHTSDGIADLLIISPDTVNTHRRNILVKTGCKNSVDLAVRCLKQGLI